MNTKDGLVKALIKLPQEKIINCSAESLQWFSTRPRG